MAIVIATSLEAMAVNTATAPYLPFPTPHYQISRPVGSPPPQLHARLGWCASLVYSETQHIGSSPAHSPGPGTPLHNQWAQSQNQYTESKLAGRPSSRVSDWVPTCSMPDQVLLHNAAPLLACEIGPCCPMWPQSQNAGSGPSVQLPAPETPDLWFLPILQSKISPPTTTLFGAFQKQGVCYICRYVICEEVWNLAKLLNCWNLVLTS